MGGISTLSRDVMVQMLNEASAIRSYAVTRDRQYLDVVHQSEALLKDDVSTCHC